MFWSKKKISEVAPQLSLSELRKRARILVIDDDERAFPHKLLQKEGYNVSYWRSVQNLRDLESGEFDIVVLDIHDIVKPEVSSNGGLGVLSHIKRYNPAQLVIAYSGQMFDPNHAEFWKLADDYLGKPSSLLHCKQKIDTLLERQFNAQYYAGSLRALLHAQGVPDSRIDKLEDAIATQKSGRRLSLEQVGKIVGIAKDVAPAVTAIVHVIEKLMSNNSA